MAITATVLEMIHFVWIVAVGGLLLTKIRANMLSDFLRLEEQERCVLEARSLRERAEFQRKLDRALTLAIYNKARAAGLEPEVEMERMRESVMYPIVFSLTVQGAHSHQCRCADCQRKNLLPEDRSHIFGDFAHAHTCVCDSCRLKSGIDAESVLSSSPMPSSWTGWLSVSEASKRSFKPQ